MKKCSTCKKIKFSVFFVKNKSSKDGLHNQCKKCKRSAYSKNREKILKLQKEYTSRNKEAVNYRKRKFRQTKHGKIMQILVNIDRRCTNPKDTHYERYGGRGIRNLISYNDISFLWDRDDASSMKRPSIDRKKVNRNYELNNCQFLEFIENSTKDSKKKVNQFDLAGNLVKTWDSLSETEIDGFQRPNIIKCCNKKRNTHKNFMWEYAK